VAGQEMNVSVSIGISIYPGDGGDIDTLMQHADVAMYHAKQDGRNAFRFFSPEMSAPGSRGATLTWKSPKTPS
jgi:predicted signal transduction protein with EAL and GGDEF domain